MDGTWGMKKEFYPDQPAVRAAASTPSEMERPDRVLRPTARWPPSRSRRCAAESPRTRSSLLREAYGLPDER